MCLNITAEFPQAWRRISLNDVYAPIPIVASTLGNGNLGLRGMDFFLINHNSHDGQSRRRGRPRWVIGVMSHMGFILNLPIKDTKAFRPISNLRNVFKTAKPVQPPTSSCDDCVALAALTVGHRELLSQLSNCDGKIERHHIKLTLSPATSIHS